MRLNLDKLYVVYNPTKYSEKVDVFNGSNTLAELFNQARKGLKTEQIHRIYTTASEAEREANRLLRRKGKRRKKAQSIKKGSGYAIFGSEVDAKDKYLVQSKPKVYASKKQAEYALKQMLRKGWKRSDLKILKY